MRPLSYGVLHCAHSALNKGTTCDRGAMDKESEAFGAMIGKPVLECLVAHREVELAQSAFPCVLQQRAEQHLTR
jgi:hypothetical protein